jgi:hypothetical protein
MAEEFAVGVAEVETVSAGRMGVADVAIVAASEENEDEAATLLVSELDVSVVLDDCEVTDEADCAEEVASCVRVDVTDSLSCRRG